MPAWINSEVYSVNLFVNARPPSSTDFKNTSWKLADRENAVGLQSRKKENFKY
jgi:hypothetical protein